MQTHAAAESAKITDLDETRRTLAASARRRFGAIPPEVIAAHVLAVTAGVDFGVRQAALDALARRMLFASRDRLVVAAPPARGAVLGAYTTRRAAGRGRREPRPYTSFLEGVSPPRGSCDCPDYLRSSLGLCKHLLVVLDHVHSRPRLLQAALRAERRRPEEPAAPRLIWDPALPLEGALDRIAGLRWELPAARGALPNGAQALQRALDRGVPSDPARRLALLRQLQAAIGTSRRSSLSATPSARALLAEEAARAERLVGCEESARDAAALRGLKRKLYPYQRAGVVRFLRAGRLLLADDMGLGKTTQAIAACHALHRSGRVRRGLLIVPASLKSQWLREWEETTDTPASIVDGPPAARKKAYRGLASGFLILNYEQLLRDLEEVQALAPDLVVLDEAQRIKNYATKSAEYVKALSPEYRLVLTGTPMENRLEELASILDWIDDVALAPKWRLPAWFAPADEGGARHLSTLRTRLSACMLRRRRAEVLADLPPRTDTRVPVEMTEQQREAHDELARPIAQLVLAAKKRPLTQSEFLRLMQLFTQQRIISNGLGQLRFEEIWPAYARSRPDAALLEGLFAPKLLELRRLVADLAVAQERKIVVFSQWRRMLRLAEWSVRDLLAEAGVRAAFFTGAESPAQRTRNVVALHDDPRVRIMFLSDAGGVGLNLQRAASACINLELPWNPAVLEQRIGRIYRLGQRRPIDVYNLVSEYGIESRIAALVGAKQALFSGLFDGTSDEVRFDESSSFMARVERLTDVGGALAGVRAAPAAAEIELQDDDDLEATDASGALADAPPGEAEAGPPSGIVVIPPAAAARAVTNGARSAPSGIADLFTAVRVEATAEGGVRIEAPPHAAGALAALFDGMARLMAAAAGPAWHTTRPDASE